MEEQSYEKHAKFVPMYHYVLFGIILLTFIGSIVNLVRSLSNHANLYSASLITALSIAVMILAVLARVFPLKAQDRAIRAEENLRHFAMTGKLLDRRLTMQQIIGLRFASDAEFPALATRAADENMPLPAIKKAIKSWRPDYDRL